MKTCLYTMLHKRKRSFIKSCSERLQRAAAAGMAPLRRHSSTGYPSSLLGRPHHGLRRALSAIMLPPLILLDLYLWNLCENLCGNLCENLCLLWSLPLLLSVNRKGNRRLRGFSSQTPGRPQRPVRPARIPSRTQRTSRGSDGHPAKPGAGSTRTSGH